jgi:hypothetical protein
MHVQAAINTAVTGDSVTIPSGKRNWSEAEYTAFTGKNINVQWAGIDVTTIVFQC